MDNEPCPNCGEFHDDEPEERLYIVGPGGIYFAIESTIMLAVPRAENEAFVASMDAARGDEEGVKEIIVAGKWPIGRFAGVIARNKADDGPFGGLIQ